MLEAMYYMALGEATQHRALELNTLFDLCVQLHKLNKTILIIFLVVLILFILPAVIVFYIVSPVPTLLSLISSKQISGKIYYCMTNMPIKDVEVSISGTGWGFSNGRLVWDKFYKKVDRSNSAGKYSINYNIGTSLKAEKEGYLQAYDYGSNGQEIDLGLLNKSNVANKRERTFKCKLSSECNKEVIKDGTTIFWDSCANPDYKP